MKLPSLIRFLILFLLPIVFTGCKTKGDPGASFSIAFFTDIHLNMGNNGCFDGFRKAIHSADSLGVDFIITGGDNVDIDVLKDDSTTAHELYRRFRSIQEESPMDFFTTIGNHDRYTGAYFEDPLRGATLFESYLGSSYYSFDHKNWHFIVLNTVEVVDGQYAVGPEQYEWLRKDLDQTDHEIPIVLVGHVPVLSVYTPAVSETYGFDSFSNFREVLNLFTDHNLKLVLQGHQHLYEEILTRDIQYITGGAVSASWWGGPYYGTEEGFLLVHFDGEEFNWKYYHVCIECSAQGLRVYDESKLEPTGLKRWTFVETLYYRVDPPI